jgi:transcriptional regulator with XRE-family HTH domain
MEFNELLRDVIPEGREIELIHFLRIKPDTLEVWINGRGKPGDKKLESIIEFIGCDKKTSGKLRSFKKPKIPKPTIHDMVRVLCPKRVDESSEKFSVFLKNLIKNVDCSVYELAERTGVTRSAMYVWLDDKALPSQVKLDALVEGLSLNNKERTKLYSLYENEKRNKPRVRSRIASAEERVIQKSIMKSIKSLGVPLAISNSPYYDIGILSKSENKSEELEATVSFRKRITSIDSVFTQACESKRVTGAEMAFVVVENMITNRMENLFDHHKISLVTNEQFIETFAYYKKSKKGNL